jgi:hypothetical protein
MVLGHSSSELYSQPKEEPLKPSCTNANETERASTTDTQPLLTSKLKVLKSLLSIFCPHAQAQSCHGWAFAFTQSESHGFLQC